jgi:hypothetical protein
MALVSRCFILALLISMTSLVARAQAWTSDRPDGHAPIGVMGDHTHSTGEVMLSYRLMYMDMEGSRIGTTSIDDDEIVSPTGEDFLITPTRMPMTMHMMGIMYAPSDRVTLMGMIPLTATHMDHRTRAGGTFTTDMTGVGDVSVTALVNLARFGRQRIHANLGVRLPTGSISKTDVTPASAPNETRLPYPMQPGSGTYDFSPGVTWLGQTDDWSGGAQASATLRSGENEAGYRLGHRFMATGWAARRLGDRWSVSLRLTSETWGNIDGADPSFAGGVANRMVPTVFTDLRGGSRIDVAGGINVFLKRRTPAQVRLAVEVSRPVYQDLDGPQLETDLQVISGLQLLF